MVRAYVQFTLVRDETGHGTQHPSLSRHALRIDALDRRLSQARRYSGRLSVVRCRHALSACAVVVDDGATAVCYRAVRIWSQPRRVTIGRRQIGHGPKRGASPNFTTTGPRVTD